MQYRITSMAVMALAASATAQQIRTFTRANQSLRDLGVVRRNDDGYQPEDETCTLGGDTCATACGEGYEQCSSTDSAIHCFNPADNESCCSTGTGSSCLASFYCTHDTDFETWCCAEGQDLESCAADFGVTDGLTLDVAPEPSSSSAVVESSSTPAPVSSSSEVVIPSSSSSSVFVEETSSIVFESSSAIPSSSSIISTTWAANSTSSYVYSPPTPTPTEVEEPEEPEAPEDDPVVVPEPSPSTVPEEGAGIAHGPAGLALVAGIAFAAILF